MKRLTIILLLCSTVAVVGCKAIKKLQQFYINYDTQAVFPANIPVGVPLTIYSPSMPTNSSQQFQNNSTNSKLIQNIKLNELSLAITSPQGQTFSFLQSISVYISSDSLPETEIAYKQNIPANVGDTLSLDVTDADLQQYIKASTIKLRVSGTTNQLTTTDIDANVHARFFVQANIFGAL